MPSKNKKSKKKPLGKRCRNECVKQYKEKDSDEFRGETEREKIEYCISAYYACCKPDTEDDGTNGQSIEEKCKERVSKKKK